MPDSRAIRALLSLGMVASLGATGTYAYWTDTATVTGTQITAGTIDIRLNSQNNLSSYTALNLSNMVPGNSVAAVINVSNVGTAPLDYFVESGYTNTDTKNLGGLLEIKITNDSATGGSGTAKTCPGTAIKTGTGFTTNLLGSAAAPRRLTAVTGNENICIQAKLSDTADTNLQGATTNVTLTFRATSF